VSPLLSNADQKRRVLDASELVSWTLLFFAVNRIAWNERRMMAEWGGWS
jgi:hypothetical protein